MASRLLSIVSLVWLLAIAVSGYTAGGINGSVKDPKGAVIVGAEVRAISAATGETHAGITDAQGRFRIDGLPAGLYKIEVSSQGFKLGQPVSIEVREGRFAEIDIVMEVAGVKEELAVESKGGVKPNSEPNYRSLRDGKPSETFAVEGLVLKRDLATLTLSKGSISFLPPVEGRVTMAVFVGEGELSLAPTLGTELDYLRKLTRQEMVKEEFV